MVLFWRPGTTVHRGPGGERKQAGWRSLEAMRTLEQLLPSHTVFAAHKLCGKPTREGFQPGVLGGQAPLLIRRAIYNVLFKSCMQVPCLLPGQRMLTLGAAVCFPGPLT